MKRLFIVALLANGFATSLKADLAYEILHGQLHDGVERFQLDQPGNRVIYLVRGSGESAIFYREGDKVNYYSQTQIAQDTLEKVYAKIQSSWQSQQKTVYLQRLMRETLKLANQGNISMSDRGSTTTIFVEGQNNLRLAIYRESGYYSHYTGSFTLASGQKIDLERDAETTIKFFNQLEALAKSRA